MPEGPEVTREAQFLNNILSNKNVKVLELNTLSGRYHENENKLKGIKKIRKILPFRFLFVKNKGKFIYFKVKGKVAYLWSTLGMTGRWTTEKNLKHNRFEIKTNKGSIYYNDIRNFGTLKFVFSKEEMKKKLDSLGPDVFDVSYNRFVERLKKYPHKKIAEILMNQKVIAGIGNYISNEMMWYAKISPHREVSTLTSQELKDLFTSMKKIIITEEYKYNFKVYMQEKDPYNNQVIKESIKGRTKHWAPNIQK